MQTLIIIDKQAISNAGIHYLAGKTGELVEVVDAQTTKELADLLEEHPAALVVMDFTLLDFSMEYLLIMHERFKQAQWMLFSEQLSNDFIRRMAFSSKAFSIVLKDATQEEIMLALVKGMHHEQYSAYFHGKGYIEMDCDGKIGKRDSGNQTFQCSYHHNAPQKYFPENTGQQCL